MPFLRQSTSQVILFGPMLDIADGVTEETALTLAQADMRLSKDGGAFAQKNATGNATHDSDGWYNTTLDATDTATVGELILNVHQPANALPIWIRWWVIEEAVYDAIYGAAATGFDASGRVDVGSWLGTAAATPTVAGVPEVDVTHQGGGAIPVPAITGVPDVNVTHQGDGVIPAPAVTGVPDVNLTHHVDVAATVSGSRLDVNVETQDNIDFGATQKASINTEVLDVANVDTVTLPGQEAPPLAPTTRQILGWLYKVLRNRKTQTATLWQLMADNETTVDAKATVSDDATTAIKQEIETGP